MTGKRKGISFISYSISVALLLLFGQTCSGLMKIVLSEIDNITPGVTDTWTSDERYYSVPSKNSSGAYVITKPEELAHIATGNAMYNSVNYFSLEADLDMSAHEWIPIKTMNVNVFEGNGHSISNLTINQPTQSDIGLFGSGGGVIQNLNLVNVNFIGNRNVGGIIGYVNSLNGGVGNKIENCTVSGTIIAVSGYAGGICANNSVNNINHCINRAKVISKGQDAGGIAASSAKQISNCQNFGDISAVGYVGGIAGNAHALVSNCLVECSITGGSDGSVGGIVGYASNSVEKSGFKGTIICKTTGYEDYGSIVGKTISQTSVQDCFGIAEILTDATSSEGIHLFGCAKSDNTQNCYAYTKIIYASKVEETRKYIAGLDTITLFKNWVYSPYVNGGFPFPTGMFAVGSVLPEQNIEAYLRSYGFVTYYYDVKYMQNSTYGTNYYVELGKYPQTYVGSSLNTALEKWYSGKTIVDTYTVDNGTGATSNVYNAYTYTDANTYVRVPAPNIYSSSAGANQSTYEDGTVDSGSPTWFKVEPIKWLILNYTDFQNGAAPVVIAEKPLAAKVTWNKTQIDQNLWSGTSNIRTWLNSTFYNDAFNPVDKGSIVNTTVQNNTQSSDADGTGVSTNDNVRLLSSNEAFGKYFKTDTQRLASPTDFAIANYCYLFTSTSYPTTARPNGGTCYYWMRSASPSDSGRAYLVLDLGGLSYAYVYHVHFAVRPALTLYI